MSTRPNHRTASSSARWLGTALASTVLLVSASAATDELRTSEQPIVYGDDNRVDVLFAEHLDETVRMYGNQNRSRLLTHG
jgi:hypothetical protein